MSNYLAVARFGGKRDPLASKYVAFIPRTRFSAFLIRTCVSYPLALPFLMVVAILVGEPFGGIFLVAFACLAWFVILDLSFSEPGPYCVIRPSGSQYPVREQKMLDAMYAEHRAYRGDISGVTGDLKTLADATDDHAKDRKLGQELDALRAVESWALDQQYGFGKAA